MWHGHWWAIFLNFFLFCGIRFLTSWGFATFSGLGIEDTLNILVWAPNWQPDVGDRDLRRGEAVWEAWRDSLKRTRRFIVFLYIPRIEEISASNQGLAIKPKILFWSATHRKRTAANNSSRSVYVTQAVFIHGPVPIFHQRLVSFHLQNFGPRKSHCGLIHRVSGRIQTSWCNTECIPGPNSMYWRQIYVTPAVPINTEIPWTWDNMFTPPLSTVPRVGESARDLLSSGELSPPYRCNVREGFSL